MANISDQESVDYQIRLDAIQALKSLESLTAEAASIPEVVAGVELAIQQMADKFGVSFNVAQAEFKEAITTAETLKSTLEKLELPSFGSPTLDLAASVKSPFGEMGQAPGFKAVNDLHRESLSLSKLEEKSAAEIAKEMNKQAAEEQEKLELRKQSLNAANQELAAVEKEGAALQQQLKNYGQISRTASEAAKYLKSFAGTEQGQSILTRFFGNYQQAQGVVQQIGAVKTSILELSKATGTTFAQSGKVFQDQFSNIPGIAKQTSTAVRELNSEFDKVPEKASRGARGVDALRIAMGVLVSMLIFNVLAAVQNAFRTMVENVREAELALYNLINAERRLSEEGIDVTPKGLQETIDSVQKLVPILSKIQTEELVSRIATNVAPSLKLTNEQIRQMAEATALLYVRNKALGKSFDEVEAQLTNAFLTGKVSQGINNLGVKLSDQIVKDEALRLGLVKTEKEFNNLTGEVEAQVKAQAMLSVVYKNATEDVQSIGKYMETADGQISRATTAWNDLLTVIGQFGGPAIAKVFGLLSDSLEGWILALELAKPVIVDWIATLMADFQALGYVMTHLDVGLFDLPAILEKFKKENIASMMFELADATDTATQAQGDYNREVEAFDAEGFKNKIEDIIEATANAREDLARNLDRKLTDLDEEYRRKAEDAERDYLRKVEDINRDAEEDIRNLKEKQRQDDIRDEEKYQLALWELRQRFLMDLEDALHARDARQVLRLQRQYAFDKEALARKHALDTKDREANQRAELKDAQDKKQQRLDDARREYEEKLADQRIAKQRELEDLNVWYAREQADIETAQQRKLETLIKGWVDEQKITADNAAAVYGILKSYFGPGGMTDALYQYMAQSLAASTVNAVNGVLSQLSGIKGGGIGGGGSTKPISGGKVTQAKTDNRPIPKFGDGGSLLATRPTTATFGEGGPELVNFTPLSKIGKNVGKLFGDTSGAGGFNGTIRVAVDLSPDLIGRIVEQSMDGVAEVLASINRSKV